jgi:flavodoxin
MTAAEGEAAGWSPALKPLVEIPENIMRYSIYLFAAAVLLAMPAVSVGESYAQEGTMNKPLILYYSRTGNTRLCGDVLQKALDADVLEIKDCKSRSGGWGFFTGAIGSLFNVHTKIEPLHPDLSRYRNIIIASPIWTGTLSTAIRTLIDTNRWDGKNVILFTTTNAAEKEKYINKSRDRAAKAGAQVLGYYQVAVKNEVNGKRVDRPRQELIEAARGFVPEIKRAFSIP